MAWRASVNVRQYASPELKRTVPSNCPAALLVSPKRVSRTFSTVVMGLPRRVDGSRAGPRPPGFVCDDPGTMGLLDAIDRHGVDETLQGHGIDERGPDLRLVHRETGTRREIDLIGRRDRFDAGGQDNRVDD